MSKFTLPSLIQRKTNLNNNDIELPNPSPNYDYKAISQHLIPIEYGLKIKEYRINNKLTQIDLANKLNIQVNILNDYENGIGIKNKTIILKLDELLNEK
jgi:ribosome-binding protein aMBF1 (putative translation factor)